MSKPTLDNLEKALRKLHPDESDRGPAFSVTYNSQLPKQANTPDDKFDLFMFMPFNRWDQEHDRTKNVLGDSFKEVVDAGLPGGPVDDIVLIDLALLNEPSSDFMHETRLIHHLADKLKGDYIKDAKVIIRLLVGCSDQGQRRDNFHPPLNGDWRLGVYERVFWQDGKNIIDHKDATLLLGYYNPTLRLSPDRPKDGSVMAWLEEQLAKFEKQMTQFDTSKPPRVPTAPTSTLETMIHFGQSLAQKFRELETYARGNDLPSMSWNHSKYLAVNGKAMMTGGFNYWNEYLRSKEVQSTDYAFLVDFGIKMQGDAAISVHAFADEIWKNLADMHPEFDARSMRWKANLGQPSPEFEAAQSGDILMSVGRFGNKPLAKSGAIKVLSTARVGQMKLDDYVYPSQLLDAFRDILLNISWHYSQAFPPTDTISGANAVYDAVDALHNLLEKTSFITDAVSTHRAAWASKYARLWAIENATQCIHMTAQSFVEKLEESAWKSDDPANPGVVDKINAAFGLPPDKQWDGVLWPYDLLVALAKALSRLATLPAPASDLPTGAAIYIILSSHNKSYGDRIKISEFKARLIQVMKHMASKSALHVATRVEDVEGIVNDRLRLRRVRNGDDHQWMHAKTLCVDRSLLYIGSDNPYPHYNAEFGCWVEDEGYVGAWFGGFYDGAWRGHGGG
ncbi:hypothetical protein QBC39DRAFT_401416 [Podospora conica]|nr:hypothetical protein QBC39DRAFT_401416 [Schizothecium conicum]